MAPADRGTRPPAAMPRAAGIEASVVYARSDSQLAPRPAPRASRLCDAEAAIRLAGARVGGHAWTVSDVCARRGPDRICAAGALE